MKRVERVIWRELAAQVSCGRGLVRGQKVQGARLGELRSLGYLNLRLL